MRRGFYSWDEAELPIATLDERRDRLQAAMARAGLDGLVLYTNIARPAAVSWLLGFTPYWSEGLLLVPKSGELEFATALSKRVGEWMRAVTPVGNLLSTPKPAEFFGRKLVTAGARRLGVMELDMLPSIQAGELLDAAPGLELVDATMLFHAARAERDSAERGLFAHATVIAREAMALVDSSATTDALALVGAIEKFIRDSRAEDVNMSIAPDLTRAAGFVRVDRAGDIGASIAIRASIAYKSTWVRRTRSVSRDPRLAARFAALEGEIDALVARHDSMKPFGPQVAAIVARAPGATLKGWHLEQCVGSYPLEIVAGSDASDAPARACSVLTIHASIDGVNWVATRPI